MFLLRTVQEYVVFGVAVFFLALYLVLETWPQWSIVLEPASHHYSVYHGSHLTVSQHCHNIYVRLVCEKTSTCAAAILTFHPYKQLLNFFYSYTLAVASLFSFCNPFQSPYAIPLTAFPFPELPLQN